MPRHWLHGRSRLCFILLDDLVVNLRLRKKGDGGNLEVGIVRKILDRIR